MTYASRSDTLQILQDAPRDDEGNLIDPNTGESIPEEGPYDYGHKPEHEWWRTQQRAREEGWTREQVRDYENDPSHYQVESSSSNRSHKYEAPR